MFKTIYLIIILGYLLSCNSANTSEQKTGNDSFFIFKDSIYTPYSTDTNQYIGFNSPNAINAIAKIENDYFNNYQKGISKYYGTIWYESSVFELDSSATTSKWDAYKQELQAADLKPDSFHCTIYAIKALKAGLGDDFEKLNSLHQQKWGKREFAGWSVAYILTKYFNWKAYLLIDEYSPEYKRCITNFKSKKNYYVWRQPDIRLENMFIIERDYEMIDSLLSQHEFGWGFSNQGIHTWITRYNQLKECRWEGSPSKKYDICDNCSPLFITHQFLEFKDYYSHVVVFPPKK